MIAHQRGTTAKVHASGNLKRKREKDEGQASLQAAVPQKRPSNANPSGVERLPVDAAGHATSGSVGPATQGDRPTSSRTTTHVSPTAASSSSTAPIAMGSQVPSPDHGQQQQHKRMGFVRRSAGQAGAKGAGKQSSQVVLLNHRDEQVNKSSGPRSPSRAARMSLFPRRT
ncbi:hypothetical protein CTheo_8997 [Ceratobasidium theobromae]|uniref:Uncharacterized protein n=1 Tax=Ceratobasidium theobromae TaxID=1582974 RepID=A0A5N5Q796_9AGAM|nr:hypothetical protein CTheo_8997 [Ceratobasidium theobromae]